MMEIRIVVALHKQYDIPEYRYLLPVFVGAKDSDLDLPYQRDDEGDNISSKNKYYCELTGLYWAYKNLHADYIGLCHYRRYLKLDRISVADHEAILPKKRHYYIETVSSQFRHAHGDGLDLTREVISDLYPEYLDAFDRQMKKRSLHLFNMFVMRYDIFAGYCDFLFKVLEELEKRIGNRERIYGFIGERLLDVYINHKGIEYCETEVISTERTDWVRKIYSFLKRKYGW